MFTNLTDALSHHARRRPLHPAIVSADETLNYQELASRVNGIAGRLVALGASPGDIVATCLHDDAWHVSVLFGVIRAGCVLLPMDVRWSVEEKRRVAEFFGARAVIVNAGAVPAGPLPHWHIDTDFREEFARAQPGEADFPSDADAPMVLSLSSGTTGAPKGPMLTHRQMVHRFVSQWVSLGFNERDRFLCATPLYFGGGRNFTLANLYTGATVVLLPPPYQPEALAETVVRQQVSSLFLVPTLLRRLLDLPPRPGLLFPHVRKLISSGSMLHAGERDAVMRRLTPNFFNLYSSTEGGSIAVLGPDATREQTATVGQAVFMNEFQIVDERHRPVPAGTVGLIRQRAPWIPAGFFNNPQETARCFVDGWYYPGDLGKVDEYGYLTIAGRAKDMIIRGGANIYPAEIEQVLRSHPAVHDAAVVAWPSRQMGEEIAAFVVCEGTPDPEALRAYCRDHLASYKVPRQVFPIDELPKNSSGKVLKSRLSERLAPLHD